MCRSMLSLLADGVSNPRVWAPASLVAKAKGENPGRSPHAAVRILLYRGGLVSSAFRLLRRWCGMSLAGSLLFGIGTLAPFDAP